MTPEEAYKHIRKLQIRALHHVHDVFAGNYLSAFKGKGLEFEEVREYQIGDDIRRIDWNVSARSSQSSQLFIKNYREERELTVMLIVDVSASSRFSHNNHLKSDLIAEVAALLAFSAIKNQDKVGLLLFSEEIELYLKPNKSVQHVLRVIRELLYFVPKYKGTNLSKALRFLCQVQRKKGICFLFSDFLTGNFSHEAALVAKNHECIAFHVSDQYERTFIPQGLFCLKDLETDQQVIVDTSDLAVRTHFEKKAAEKFEKVKRIFGKTGIDYMMMHTDESAVEIIRRFFHHRKLKR